MNRKSWRATSLVAGLFAFALIAAACGDSDSGGTTTGGDAAPATTAAAAAPATTAAAAAPATTAAAAPATTAAPEPAAPVCPERIVIQTDWFPEPEHGAVYNLIGPDGELDSSNGKYVGPLQAKYAEPYGDNVPIIEIRAGGPFLGEGSVHAAMYVDDNITLGYTSTDISVQFSDQLPTLGVVTPLDLSPLIVMWDPETYPDVTTISELSDTGANILVFTDQNGWVKFMVGTGVVTDTTFEAGYDGSPARFITEGDIGQQSFVSNEVYKYKNDFEEYGRDVNFQLVHDVGFEPYPGAGTLGIRTEDKAALDSCLKLFVPTVQQSAVDYMDTDFGPVNATMRDHVEAMASFWTLSPGGTDNAIEVMRDLELYSNGTDGDAVFGNFDLPRIQRMIDVLLPIFEADGLDSYNPDVTPEDLVTNEYIDPTISA